MGKYTAVLRGLPSYQGEDASFNEKVVAKRLSFGPLSATLAAQGYADVRKRKAELDEELSKVNVEVAAWEGAMFDAFDNEGITQLKLATGQSISTYPEPYAQVADPQAFRDWCIEQGLGNRMSLAWTTTNSIAKEQLLAGEEPPPGIKIFVKNRSRLAKGA
jgi:hypothetical protein